MLRAASGSGELTLLPGTFAMAGLPVASACYHHIAWVTDKPGGAGFMLSDGAGWVSPTRRIDTYQGLTDGSGDYAIGFSSHFPTVPNVQPVLYGADALTRARVTAQSTAGFTVRAEKNLTLNVLGVDLLGIGVAAVPGAAVRVLVIETT